MFNRGQLICCETLIASEHLLQRSVGTEIRLGTEPCGRNEVHSHLGGDSNGGTGHDGSQELPTVRISKRRFLHSESSLSHLFGESQASEPGQTGKCQK